MMAKTSNKKPHPPIAKGASVGATTGALLVILLIAATLRFVHLDQVPPGLHVDEAANAWNAYTLLKTGTDQHGVSWPIFYTRAFGENRSPMYIYALMPFQAIGGLNVWTTRMPAAVGGVISVLLMFFVGARLFDRWTGLVAAGLLALNPWHLQISRYAFEASLVSLLILLSLAALIWAGLPLTDNDERPPRPWAAAGAGLLIGVSCYGYWAVRLFLPLFLISMVVANWRVWWDYLVKPRGFVAIGALALGAAITLGPLFWKHMTDPEIVKRGQIASWVWTDSDSLEAKIVKVASRYPGHFGLDFLFISGDHDPALSPPQNTGLLHWYELPGLLLGLTFCLFRVKASRAARTMLVWLALYPIADLLNAHVSLHSLRSLPGLGGLILITAVGIVGAGRWVTQYQRRALPAFCGGIAVVVALTHWYYLERLFVDFPRDKATVPAFDTEMLDAARWLRSRLSDRDAVFVTGRLAHPYINTLIGLEYEPVQWFNDQREIVPGPLPDGRYKDEDVYRRVGRISFMIDQSSIDAIQTLIHNGRSDKVVFIVTPGELGLQRLTQPVKQIIGADGQAKLWIFDLVL
jgi:4-amino-4-deoxy-L-arabinose transferase-like glycosyltransferase